MWTQRSNERDCDQLGRVCPDPYGTSSAPLLDPVGPNLSWEGFKDRKDMSLMMRGSPDYLCDGNLQVL